jgi:hypothetical protein
MASDSCRFIFLLSDQPYFLSFDLKLSRLFWSPVFLNSDHLYLASILIHLHVCCIFKSIGAFFWPISWVWLCDILIICWCKGNETKKRLHNFVHTVYCICSFARLHIVQSFSGNPWAILVPISLLIFIFFLLNHSAISFQNVLDREHVLGNRTLEVKIATPKVSNTQINIICLCGISQGVGEMIKI